MRCSSLPTRSLAWQELLSAKEVKEWADSRKQPNKLWRLDGVSKPGVYRFVFPDDASCYIGVAGHFGTRLRDHILPTINPTSAHSGWSVRGAISNSLGTCHVQYLEIKNSIRIYEVVLNKHSFDDYFSRLLLENWAILHAERIEGLRPLNRDVVVGIHQGTKDFRRLAAANLVKADRLEKVAR